MQYDENAEKYGYDGEMTPIECAELQAYKGDVTIPVYGTIADAEVYLKKEADEAIAELKAEVNNLLMQNSELCQALQVMYSAEEYTILQAENAELKQKLENVQASMYCDVVDANMDNRRLRRALWLCRYGIARLQYLVYRKMNVTKDMLYWYDKQKKFRAKAEEYK